MDSSYLTESSQQKNYKLVAALSTFFKLKIEAQNKRDYIKDSYWIL